MFRIFIVTILLLCVYLPSSGQSTYILVDQFNRTKFIQKFDSTRISIERNIRSIKARENRAAIAGDGSLALDAEKMERYKTAYDSYVNQYNEILLDIKNEMSTGRGRKKFSKNSRSKLKKYYSRFKSITDEYNSLTAAVMKSNDRGFPLLLTLISLVTTIMEDGQLIGLFKSLDQQMKEIDQNILQEYLYEAHKFHIWNEIN